MAWTAPHPKKHITATELNVRAHHRTIEMPAEIKAAPGHPFFALFFRCQAVDRQVELSKQYIELAF